MQDAGWADHCPVLRHLRLLGPCSSYPLLQATLHVVPTANGNRDNIDDLFWQNPHPGSCIIANGSKWDKTMCSPSTNITSRYVKVWPCKLFMSFSGFRSFTHGEFPSCTIRSWLYKFCPFYFYELKNLPVFYPSYNFNTEDHAQLFLALRMSMANTCNFCCRVSSEAHILWRHSHLVR